MLLGGKPITMRCDNQFDKPRWSTNPQAPPGDGPSITAAAVVVVRQQIGKSETHVFSYRGNSIRQVNTKAWRAALKRVGIADFRWHDLRHTWASWHVQSGTPLHALQELGGLETAEMVRRYAYLSSEHLAQYVEQFSPLRVVAREVSTIELRAAGAIASAAVVST